jgi:hypothetical protein
MSRGLRGTRNRRTARSPCTPCGPERTRSTLGAAARQQPTEPGDPSRSPFPVGVAVPPLDQPRPAAGSWVDRRLQLGRRHHRRRFTPRSLCSRRHTALATPRWLTQCGDTRAARAEAAQRAHALRGTTSAARADEGCVPTSEGRRLAERTVIGRFDRLGRPVRRCAWSSSGRGPPCPVEDDAPTSPRVVARRRRDCCGTPGEAPRWRRSAGGAVDSRASRRRPNGSRCVPVFHVEHRFRGGTSGRCST